MQHSTLSSTASAEQSPSNATAASLSKSDFAAREATRRLVRGARSKDLGRATDQERVVELAPPDSDAIRNVPKPRQEILIVLKDWEGVVEEIGSEGYFIARLRDNQIRESAESELAEIPMTEVPPDDVKLVQAGAIFYLTVYRRVLPSGRHERTTRLFFRRLPAWTPSMLRSARGRAGRWKGYFGVAESKSAGA